jgi:HTH-type transcriptional regulator/antitoxin HigA
MLVHELDKVIPIWPQISEILSVPHSEDHYQKLTAILDSLTDEIGESENHPLASLMEIIGNLIENYEERHHPIEESDPIGVLRALMEENSLTQNDLSDIGSQGVVSEILNGKRSLNVRQIKRLSSRFNVSPSVFL